MPFLPERLATIRSHRLFPLAFFLGLSLLLYANTLPGDFVYDDRFFSMRAELRQISYLWNTWFEPSLPDMLFFPHYRPLSFATYALNYIVFGASPLSFHVVNILLNGIVCWLLFLITNRLFHERALAWCVAILFAMLPIHTEAVGYIKARDEMLVPFFGLLAWLAFLRSVDASDRRRVLWSVFAALLSLATFFSKESGLVVPGIFVGSLVLLRGWRALRGAWFPISLQVVAIAVYFVFHGVAVGWKAVPDIEILYFGQNPLGYMDPRFVPWTAAALFFTTVAKTFVPVHLSATYGFSHFPIVDSALGTWMAPMGLLIACMLALLTVWPSTRRTPLGVGALAFLVLYIPFSKFPIDKGIDFFAERWAYGPSIGLSLIGGYGAWLLLRHHKAVAPVVFAVVIAAYVMVLVPRNMVWRSDTTLGESMVLDAPNSVISYVMLANDRMQYGRVGEAIDLVTRGLEVTRKHIPLHQVAATVALTMGNLPVADQAIAQAEALGDERTNVILRCTLLAKQGRFQESFDALLASHWYDESDYRVRLLLALNLWRLGRRDEAEEFFDWDTYTATARMTREEKVHMLETY